MPKDPDAGSFAQEEMVMDYNRCGEQGQIKMLKTSYPEGWLYDKYGDNVMPWECQLKLANLVNNSKGEWTDEQHGLLSYKYRMLGPHIYNDFK